MFLTGENCYVPCDLSKLAPLAVVG
jgi:hypothetical protein